MLRKIPPAGYVLALICFLLPFVEVSCNGQKVASLTGAQLLTGSRVNSNGGMFGAPKQEIKPNTSVLLAFLVGVAGLVLSLFDRRLLSIIAGTCGILSALCLFGLQQSLMSGVPPEAMGLLQLQYQPGYYLSVLLFFASAALIFYSQFANRVPVMTAAPHVAPSPPPPQSLQAHASYAAAGVAVRSPAPATASPNTTWRFCVHCGQQIARDDKFCLKCGTAQA